MSSFNSLALASQEGIFESSLIKEVKEYEFLWKTSPKGALASKNAQNAWVTVKNNLQSQFGYEIPLSVIRRKWKYLRDHYIRQRKDILKRRAILGMKYPVECKWRHYKELKFLNKANIKSRSNSQYTVPQIYFENIQSEHDQSEHDEQTNLSIMRLNTTNNDYSGDSSVQHYTLQYADPKESGQSQKEVQIQLDLSNYQNLTSENLNNRQYQQTESIIIPVIQSDQLQQLQHDQSSNAIFIQPNGSLQQSQSSLPSTDTVSYSNANQNVEFIDQNDLFAKYISVSLKKLNQKFSSKAKLEIQQILSKYEQESFNESQSMTLSQIIQQPQVTNIGQVKVSRNHYSDYVIRPIDSSSYNKGQYTQIICDNGTESTNEIEVIAIDDDIKTEDIM